MSKICKFKEGQELTLLLGPGRHFKVVRVNPELGFYTLEEIPDGPWFELNKDIVEQAFRKSNAFDIRDAEDQRRRLEPDDDPDYDIDGFPRFPA